jgi:hypothetical protein
MVEMLAGLILLLTIPFNQGISLSKISQKDYQKLLVVGEIYRQLSTLVPASLHPHQNVFVKNLHL